MSFVPLGLANGLVGSFECGLGLGLDRFLLTTTDAAESREQLPWDFIPLLSMSVRNERGTLYLTC